MEDYRVINICGHDVKVDEVVADDILKEEWSVSVLPRGNVYFFIRVAGTTLWLHRIMADAPKDVMVDHINGDYLDNRACNLRPANHSQNQQNRKGPRRDSGTGVRGVYFDKRKRSYRAYIVKDKKYIHLGNFKTLDEATQAAHQARLEMFTHY
jgi:hypothetical protein